MSASTALVIDCTPANVPYTAYGAPESSNLTLPVPGNGRWTALATPQKGAWIKLAKAATVMATFDGTAWLPGASSETPLTLLVGLELEPACPTTCGSCAWTGSLASPCALPALSPQRGPVVPVTLSPPASVDGLGAAVPFQVQLCINALAAYAPGYYVNVLLSVDTTDTDPKQLYIGGNLALYAIKL
jgi:hypothetical protein